MLLNVEIPNEQFNKAVSDGSLGDKMRPILEGIKPETAYFIEQNGRRGAIIIVDVAGACPIPPLAEPWFLTFNAEVGLRIAMSLDDTSKAGLEGLGKRWPQ
jgi:hypothetical protein